MTLWLLRLARWIAGPDRADWTDGMAAEAEASGAQSTAWASGCLWASLQDRLMRERKFLLSILLVPVGALLVTVIVVFALSWLFFRFGSLGPIYSGILALVPLPFAYQLGASLSLRRAVIAASICFLLYLSAPMILTWVQFGKLFIGGTSIYGLPGLSGYGLGLFVWLAGAWLGSRRQAA